MAQVTREQVRPYRPRLNPLPEYGCIWVRNAKVATSTTMLWLHRAYTGDHGFVPQRSIHNDNALPRPRDVGWDRVAAMLSGEAYRFAFVREPVARVESAYRNKATWSEFPGRAELHRILGLPEGPEQVITPEQFVTALEVQEPIEMNSHWRPQHLNLMHPLVEYDMVGRLETFKADLARIREAVGFPDVPIEVKNATAGASLFDGPLQRRLEAIYAKDFELYGY